MRARDVLHVLHVLQVLLLAPILVSGCISFAPPVVTQQYTALHGCSEKNVKVVGVQKTALEQLDGVDVYRATGCGVDDVYYCRYQSCSTARKIVTDRHAAELECARDEVEVRSLGSGTWLAKGCGEKRTYNCAWTGGALRCLADTARSE